MSWDEIYRNMAFQACKSDFADRMNLRDALVTLISYVQGQSKAYEANDALALLERRFGMGVQMAISLFRKGMEQESESAREVLCLKSIDLIERYLRRNHSAPLD
jgi:hypothetical protein